MKASKLLIWAETSVAIGTGHVMRCLALAQAWKRAGGAATFLLQEGSSGVAERIVAEGFSLETVREQDLSRAFVRDSGCELVVLDGYGIGSSEQAALRAAGVAVLFLDDYGHADHYSARWVLNQNPYAQPGMYAKRDGDTRLLLGPAYALLREEFLPWIGWTRTIADRATKILVTMGGSDAGNASTRILGSLVCLGRRDLEVVVAVGGGNPHQAALQRAIEQSPVRIRMMQNVRDMPALMAWADIAIAAAGGTSYELCYMGLPSILLVAADNQRGVAESLASLGAAADAGAMQEFKPEAFVGLLCALLESSAQRKGMSQKGRELVDGMGAERVRAALVGRELRLRPLRENDCQLLFEWANDLAARAASFHPAPISWEEHTVWFAERVRDPQSVVYIGENETGTAVGQVRFQLRGESALLSVSVAPQFRGGGWGRELVTFATRSLAREHPVSSIDALVKPDNEASIRLFEKSGFQRAGMERIADQEALRFTWGCKVEAHAS